MLMCAVLGWDGMMVGVTGYVIWRMCDGYGTGCKNENPCMTYLQARRVSTKDLLWSLRKLAGSP